ncbi:MAG: type II/IV secretion system protein [Phycisphaeraceae bacterium]|nr:MAG: type II/IV secretion system protein [Phycisphaeraceae bacterium]
MSKFDIDSLLNELGSDEDDAPVQPGAARDPRAEDESAFTEVFRPEEDHAVERELGQVLLERSIITPAQLTSAQTVIRQSPGRRMIDVLLEQEVEEEGVQRVVAELSCLPFERIDVNKIDDSVEGKLLQRLTPGFCKQHEILPLRTEGSRVVLGAVRPDDVFLIDEVRRRLGLGSLKIVVLMRADIRAVLDIYGESTSEDVDVDSILNDIEEDDVQVQQNEQEEVDLEKQAGESPVIRYVNYILQTAVKEGASDIHIEPQETRLKVRFRIDGILFEAMNPPAAMNAAITSRLKIMANLDISERRLPQDGRIRCVVRGRKLDLRVSTIPTANGEKVVMRILDTRSINVSLDELGFDENTLGIWKNQIEEPHGIILVTGPTGSGKTTTLYASLRQMDKQRMNISTVEDPVEYHLEGVTQTQTHEKIGMTFARALKALLRQDPDVVMIGEIRDMETAATAVQAALTGHLVLSTLHTNDAPSSVTRLINIGIEPFLVGAALNGVLAQRLVRRICQHCKEESKPSEEMAEFLELNGMGAQTLYTGKGCDKCRNTGFSGRVGIYELLVMDDQTRDIVARNPNVSEFRRLCVERGMTSLREDGLQKVRRGLTTVTEILRVTESSH